MDRYSAVPWIVEALRHGIATETGEGITLPLEYLETVGYHREADVLSLDFTNEDWLDAAEVFAEDGRLIFSLPHGLLFLLPLDSEILQGAHFLSLSLNGIPIAPCLPITPWAASSIPAMGVGFVALK